MILIPLWAVFAPPLAFIAAYLFHLRYFRKSARLGTITYKLWRVLKRGNLLPHIRYWCALLGYLWWREVEKLTGKIVQ